jgi:hypothetical protein
MARHVNSKSLEVMGEPSSHTAAGFKWNATRAGGPASRSPFSRDGALESSGEATKLPSWSSCMARGRTCSRTVHHVQSADAHEVSGFTHSGHCSAPKTMEEGLTPGPGEDGGAGEAAEGDRADGPMACGPPAVHAVVQTAMAAVIAATLHGRVIR